jgi:N-acetyl-anhydromuramyl-L-alanine amidase AmpD
MQIVQRLITRNVYSFRGNPSRIVLHTYGGPGTSLYNWFQNNTHGVSAHYAVMMSGIIEQYVPDTRIAGHAGNREWNRTSIGIEHQDNGNPADGARTTALYNASAELVFTLCKKYNIPPTRDYIVPHKQLVSTRSCPGGLNINRIIDQAKKYMDELNALRKRNAELEAQAKQTQQTIAKLQAEINLLKGRADAAEITSITGFLGRALQWLLQQPVAMIKFFGNLIKTIFSNPRA